MVWGFYGGLGNIYWVFFAEDGIAGFEGLHTRDNLDGFAVDYAELFLQLGRACGLGWEFGDFRVVFAGLLLPF